MDTQPAMGQAHTPEVTLLQLASIPLHQVQVVVRLFLITHPSPTELAEVQEYLQSEAHIIG